jgi:DNA-binding XRE family transcriptional regulator
MPSTKNYRRLHDQVAARPGAAQRLAVLRDQTLTEIGLYELRKALERSQTELGAKLNISQSAVSQLERADDLRLSTLRNYLAQLGARLQLVAVFDEDGEEHSVPIHIGGPPATGP